MSILLIFAFISGLVTIAAPCIWPLLPIILSSSSSGGHRKPFGITLGIVTSFAFFTLALSYIVKIIPFDPNILRLFAVIVIGLLGLSLLIPALSLILEGFVSKLSSRFGTTQNKSNGFWPGYIIGFSLGIVWAPCSGPILATIATLAATQAVNFKVILVTLAYVTGIGIPLFIFATIGKKVFTRTRFFSKYTGTIQQIFGLIMILTAAAIFTNFDKTLEIKLLNIFPSYSNLLYKLEGQQSVTNQLNQLKQVPGSSTTENLGPAPDFIGGTKWLNTDKPLSLTDLKGKVVLVDFWTYTCINCIRTLPYVTSWFDKYKDKGFVVIGVHTPEFEFEKNTDNVLSAIKQYNIHYPVLQDNNYTIWQLYSNQYWPAEYLIDSKGMIRHVHFGEGEYDQTEIAIQNLLKETGQNAAMPLSSITDQTPKTDLTPETYLSLSKMERFASIEQAKLGVSNYSLPLNLPLNNWAFSGNWDIEPEYAASVSNSSLNLNFLAAKVFLVITPVTKEDVVKVSLDNKPLTEIKVTNAKLYTLINLNTVSTHLLHLDFKTPGTKIYAFTFGD